MKALEESIGEDVGKRRDAAAVLEVPDGAAGDNVTREEGAEDEQAGAAFHHVVDGEARASERGGGQRASKEAAEEIGFREGRRFWRSRRS